MMRRMDIECVGKAVPGAAATVGGVDATIEDVESDGTVHARLGNGATVTGRAVQGKSWPPAGIETKVSPGQSGSFK